jgi:hypothetical protein
MGGVKTRAQKRTDINIKQTLHMFIVTENCYLFPVSSIETGFFEIFLFEQIYLRHEFVMFCRTVRLIKITILNEKIFIYFYSFFLNQYTLVHI